IITVVMRVVNLGDDPAQALHAFDLRDAQQRLFNMADHAVFPGYLSAQMHDALTWPDLRADYTVIAAGESAEMLVAFKVASDSSSWELTEAPLRAERCRPPS